MARNPATGRSRRRYRRAEKANKEREDNNNVKNDNKTIRFFPRFTAPPCNAPLPAKIRLLLYHIFAVLNLSISYQFWIWGPVALAPNVSRPA